MPTKQNSAIDYDRFPNEFLTRERQQYIYDRCQNIRLLIDQLGETNLTPRQKHLLNRIHNERLQLLAAVVIEDESLMEEKGAPVMVV